MNPVSSFQQVAKFLDARKESIIADWLKAVRHDPEVPTATDLPRHELMDHLPMMLSALADQLHGMDSGDAAAVNSQVHGKYRWSQNYDLGELLEELSVLREILGSEFQNYFKDHGTITGEDATHLANRCLHRFLDNEIAHSVKGFVSSQQEEIRAMNLSLQETNSKIQIFNDQLKDLDERRLKMLRTVSHELGNHLQGLSIIASFAQKQADWEEVANHLEVISSSVRAMGLLTKQLLEFALLLSGKDYVKKETCDLVALHGEISDYLRSLATEKGLGFASEIEPSLKFVQSDRQKLHRICMNLGTNAVKYTESGSIYLAFRKPSSTSWAIEVKDTGVGIPVNEQELIFQEFYRIPGAHENERGAGLGLAIITQLAQILGGQHEVQSEEGKGSCFRVILPL